MSQKFSNAARSALMANILAGDTSLTVDISKADLFPVADTGTDPVPTVGKDWFKIVLEDSSHNIEIVYVRTRTLGSASMTNLLRGQEGTTARAYLAGSVVGLRHTAIDLADAVSFAAGASSFWRTLVGLTTAALSRVALGATVVGDALFTASDAAAARLAIGAAASGTLANSGITGAAPRAIRIDVASVAGTVDLTANAPNTDDIRFTGALPMTDFIVAAGRDISVVAGGASTLVNGANLITQTGANIVCGAGDTYRLRAIAANQVEVMNFVSAAGIPNLSITGAKIAAATITPDKLSGAQSGSAPAYALRAWCVFNGGTAGTNAPTAGGNVTSVQRVSAGTYTVNFSTAMPDANYAASVLFSIATSANQLANITGQTTSSFSFEIKQPGVGNYDVNSVFVMVAR